ncbi:MAG: hypothetical protein HY527_07825 [Betaproteobacteria bacterium]|nr:hypothetical protein [Betaproteobacteria bacterium]
MPALDTAVTHYLHHTLGIVPKLRSWASTSKLPYFLQDAFELRELQLLDRQILLAIDRQANKPALANVHSQLDKLRALVGHPVVYVTGALASYERKRLIEQKVPFIVPGNQLYLPDLGIDLREYFRQRSHPADTVLSPATQAMLITALLRKPWQADWQPAEISTKLGYTPMTLSRAVKELTAAGIATLHSEGRARRLRMASSPAEIWERAKPLLRNPVKRCVWAHPIPKLKPPQVRLAGLSALARYSMLAEPQWPIYAVSPAQWKAATLEALPEQLPGACEWQLWHYNPALVSDGETVDPLSLALSLQDETDERVQLALGELKEHFPW